MIPSLIILGLTIVGIPLAGMLFLAFIIEIYLTKHIVALGVGHYLNKRFKRKKQSPIATFILGLTLYSLFTAIPVFGGLVGLLGFLLGLGALSQYFIELIKKQK